MTVQWLNKRRLALAALYLGLAVILAWWRPYVLVEGVQRSCLYAMIALPMALILGVLGIINLAHGEFMMLGAYLAYWFNVRAGLDPLLAALPLLLVFFILGLATYVSTIKHVLAAEELIQLLLTFGLGLVISQMVNLIWTSQPRKVQLDYVSASAAVGGFSFGTFEFIYVGAAVLVLIGLLLFMKYTRTGQAATAVGQNPRGAALVGIDVDRTYLMVFSISVALVGAMGALFMTRHSIFPAVGGSFTLKSFCLVAMAGMGNLSGILWCSLILGLAENLVLSIRGYSGWADIIFFALIGLVIIIRSRQRQST